ncbi:olfactory receptor 14A16-like [Pantherophis guttatus]|uniref:Olfactory receptor n=1 Tax=Pantherophis guttatus TaxID=94885 RepID=A0A6P9CG92_PANGU|nr:olfactory receptor 14A16-like [Pantherophis guttatus]
MDNQSITSDFMLFNFTEREELKMFYFFVFIVLYLAVLTGNLLIISVILCDHHLHNPMYFFLMNLAIQDLGAISVIVPKSIANILMNTRHISYFGCVCQVFFVVFFMSSDFWILTVMAYDRYVAICNPLHYETIMNKQASICMILAVWVSSLFNALLHTCFTFATPFCSNIINQIFCEIPQLLKLTCMDLNKNEIKLIIVICILCLGCFFYILTTYVSVFKAVLKIPSKEGRKKAFSTCLPHLFVASIFLLSSFIAYMKPPSSVQDLATTVLYCFIPPLLNPLIYSMRNKEIRFALSKLLKMRNLS